VIEDPEPLAGDRLVGLLSDGHLLGTDDLGRDVLSMVVHGAGVTLVASVVPALLATAVGVGLALLGRAVAPLDEPVVGLPLEVLTWMAPLVLVAYAIGEGATSLTAPVFLLVVTVVLVPTATRACRRVLDGDTAAEIVLSAGGVAASLAVSALVVVTTAGLLGLERSSGGSSWGTALAQSLQSLSITPRVGAVFGWAVVLTALAFHLLGASLLALARRSPRPTPMPPPATPF
jgi:peptide/nickel transport system permease protein